jgi:glutathione S-transferase
MESTAIAAKLDSLYPDPPLRMDNGLLQKVGPLIGKSSFPLIPVFMPRIGRDVVVESSYDYFQEARAKRFGMSLDELEKAKGGDPAWQAAQPGLKQLSELIAAEKKDEGPFIQGSQVCYADFIIASMVEALRRISSELYTKIEETVEDRNILQIHAACQRWMEDDQ